jgi:cysteinyl-tRNA synthetase
MSKSLNNIVTISKAVKKYSGQVVRLALLSAHYSQPLNWNDELLENQKATIEKWYKLYEKTQEENILDISDALLDDLNTPGFIAKIHELYNSAIKNDKKSKILFNNACRLLGLFNIDKNQWENFKKLNRNISEELILKMIDDRNHAKKNKNFDLADKIRQDLLNKGVSIEDLKDKTIWKFK